MTTLEQISPVHEYDDGIDIVTLFSPAAARWKLVLLSAVIAGAVAAGASYLVAPKYIATTVFLPPPQQGGSSNALASLGALGLGGGNINTRNSPDQFATLMQSVTVSDRIIAKFDLRKQWGAKFKVDARKILSRLVKIESGKKDGLMQVSVTDTDPARAAAIANQYVVELRTLTNTLAVTEAQQRRVFFEGLLEKTRDKLADAQTALETSGYSAGALNAQPSSAAEGYARVQAQLTAAEVKLQVLRSSLANAAPEVRVQQEAVNALASQLAKLEAQDKAHPETADYVNRYREFKYQETLFDLFARQYESARVDESKEGGLIQVLDSATPPERKDSPRRSLWALVGALLGGLVAVGYFTVKGYRAALQPAG